MLFRRSSAWKKNPRFWSLGMAPQRVKPLGDRLVVGPGGWIAGMVMLAMRVWAWDST